MSMKKLIEELEMFEAKGRRKPEFNDLGGFPVNFAYYHHMHSWGDDKKSEKNKFANTLSGSSDSLTKRVYELMINDDIGWQTFTHENFVEKNGDKISSMYLALSNLVRDRKKYWKSFFGQIELNQTTGETKAVGFKGLDELEDSLKTKKTKKTK